MLKKSICNMCFLRCGLNVYVVNNRIEKVMPMQEHPFNTLCPKAQGIGEWVHSPARITHPLKRSKGGWRKISWDDAFEYLADELAAIKDKYGAKSLVVYSGMAFAGTYDVRAVVQRFCDLYGTPNLTRGTNPEESRIPLALKIKRAKRRGAKLIVIDPRKTNSRPDLVKEFPLILITGPRVRWFTHSQHRNVPTLRKKMPEPFVEINPRTAQALGISDGDKVNVKSLRGEITLKAKVTADIHPQVVCLNHGWEEANANMLVDDTARDPISGYPSFKSLLCRVARA